MLLYDPDCGFCTTTANRMRGWGLGCAIEPITPLRLAELGVDPRRVIREVPFVHDDGRVVHGSDAMAAALRTGALPLRVAGAIISSAPVRPLAQLVYRQVAAHRHQLPGGTAACELR